MSTPIFLPELDRSVILDAESPLPYDAVFEEISTPDMVEQIGDGRITLAMIRPQLAGNTIDPGTDSEIAQRIEERVMGLGVITKFAVVFDREAVNSFYGGGPQEVQLGLPPERLFVYANRWAEFLDLMTSGPTTVLILQSLGKDAISRWRSQVGHYDIVNRRDITTIRGQFGHGIDNYNNLIHGSDGPDAVLNEIRILRDLVKRQGIINANAKPRN